MTAAPRRCSPSRCPTTSGRTNTSWPWSGRCWACTCPGIRSTAWRTCWPPRSTPPIPAILDGDVANDTQVRVGGILASVNRRVNKNGMPWASAQLEDLTGGIEVMFFPHAYSAYGADIVDDAVVLVNAKVAIRDDRISLIANELVVPDFSSAQANRPLAVSLPTRQCTLDKVSALKQVLARHPGTSQVHLRLISGDRITTLELDASLRVTLVAGADGRSEGAARVRGAWAARGESPVAQPRTVPDGPCLTARSVRAIRAPGPPCRWRRRARSAGTTTHTVRPTTTASSTSATMCTSFFTIMFRQIVGRASLGQTRPRSYPVRPPLITGSPSPRWVSRCR